MSDSALPWRLSRRTFLHRAALAAGALAGGSLLAACAAPAAQPTPTTAPKPTAPPAAAPTPTAAAAKPTEAPKPAATTAPAPTTAPAAAKPVATGPLKLGVVLPFSQVYAQLGADIVDGMNLYFESVGNRAGGRTIELLKEDEENDPQVALRKTRKLVEQDRVELLTGVVSTAVVYALRDYIHNSQVVFLCSNAGGNDLTRARKSPYIFRTSFTSWQVSFPAGDYLARNVGKKFYISAADYGFGRESAAAFRESFEKAGGTVVGESYPKLGNEDYGPFLPQIQGSGADGVYCFYSGSDAVKFVKQYDEFGLKRTVKLTGAGFLVEEDVLPAQGDAALGTINTLFWARTLDNPENKKFVADYESKYKRPVSVFALQGFDTARVIVEALNKTGGDTANKDALIKAIEGVKFASPRGPFEFDPATHNVILTVYAREVRTVDGKPTNVVIANLGQFRDPG